MAEREGVIRENWGESAMAVGGIDAPGHERSYQTSEMSIHYLCKIVFKKRQRSKPTARTKEYVTAIDEMTD